MVPVFVPPAPERATEAPASPTARPLAPKPAAEPVFVARSVVGVVSWYPVPGMVAATHSWRWGQTPFHVKVCTPTRCISVLVQDYCDACVNGRLLDLADGAFAQLAPLSVGLVRVEVTGWR